MEDKNDLGRSKLWDCTMVELDASPNCLGMGRLEDVWLQ